ncbi:MAG: exodeoxyribonuclease III [Candidatus Moraniibacteriota bacterium]
MKTTFISWNVNGIRAAERKGFVEWIEAELADIVAVQETKISHSDQLSHTLKNPDGYTSYWHPATEKKGYSGTAIYTKREPLSVKTDFGESLLSREGRVIEMELAPQQGFAGFVFLNIYFPNGGSGAERLKYKMQFYAEFLNHIQSLVQAGKSVIFCGDVNTAHREIDLARPKENRKTSGFLPTECAWLDAVEQAGFVDTYRLKHPDQVQYSWWDMKSRARDRNIGWRIDYFWVSQNLVPHIQEAFIQDQVIGSDHAPVGLTLEI